MYWQYTTAAAGSVVAAMNPLTSSNDSAIESFIFCLLHSEPQKNTALSESGFNHSIEKSSLDGPYPDKG